MYVRANNAHDAVENERKKKERRGNDDPSDGRSAIPRNQKEKKKPNRTYLR